MSTSVQYVTKSLQLTEDEARELADIVDTQTESEPELLRRWVLDRMQKVRLDRAVAAYANDEADLRDAARMAGIPIGAFIEELGERHIPLLDDPKAFSDGLRALRAMFGTGPGVPPSIDPL
jgi:predicted HTH domain antitoxin